MSAVKQKRDNRRETILRLVHENEAISVDDLAQAVGVSPATLRRELRLLADEGLLQRRAGRAFLNLPSDEEMPFPLRQSLQGEEKRRIAARALELVQNGETIMIAGGTTSLEFARLLPGRRRLTVITNALPVANVLVDRPGITLILLGGEVRPGEQTTHGHLTELGVQELRAGQLFYGVQGVSPQHGLTHNQLREVSTDRALAASAGRVVVLADHTKLGRVAPALVLPLGRVHTLVTGQEAPADFIAEVRAQGVQVLLA